MTTKLDRIHAEIKQGDKVMAKDVILRELLYVKPDNFWYGYGQLQDTLLALGITHRLCPGMPVEAGAIKKLLRELKAEDKVCTRPVFGEDGKINGTGWFAV